MKKYPDNYRFYDAINECVLKKMPYFPRYYGDSIYIGKLPKLDKGIIVEVNYNGKRKSLKGTEYKAWLDICQCESKNSFNYGAYGGHKIHTPFMTIDEMADFIIELYDLIRNATKEEIMRIFDDYEQKFLRDTNEQSI